MNLLERYRAKQIERLSAEKVIPDFIAGDQVAVSVEITEGTTKRIQIFEGLCIARKNRGAASTFTVRKLASNGVGAERVFPLYSPRIKNIKVLRLGKVRRAKLYYMRALRGKAARIKERTRSRVKSSSAA